MNIVHSPISYELGEEHNRQKEEQRSGTNTLRQRSRAALPNKQANADEDRDPARPCCNEFDLLENANVNHRGQIT
jgi:hypothetical protein